MFENVVKHILSCLISILLEELSDVKLNVFKIIF